MTSDVVLPRRTALREAGEVFAAKGNPTLLLSSFLFLFLAVFAGASTVIGFSDFLSFLFQMREGDILLLSVVGDAVFAAFIFFLILPLWLGRLRLAERMCRGEEPTLREMFHFFKKRALYARSLKIAAVLFLLTALPLLAVYGLFRLPGFLFAEVLDLYFPPDMAAFGKTFAWFFSVLLAVCLFFLTAFYRLFAVIAVKSEDSGVFAALRMSLGAGKGNFFTICLFDLSHLWRLIVGLLTLGVLQILYFNHLYLLSYSRLSTALCPKGE